MKKMAISHTQPVPSDFYTANEDFTGRSLDNAQELVEYQGKSTMRIWYNVETYGFASHWHSALEIIMPQENYYDVTINEEAYRIQPGEILAIPPGSMHCLTAPATGSRFIFLFDISYMTRLKGFAGISSVLVQPLYISRETFPLLCDELRQILLKMTDEYFGDNEYKELTIISLLMNFFVRLGQNRIDTGNLFPNVKLTKQKAYVQKFNDLLDYIDSHYMEDLTLEEVAGSIGFSKFHFARLFRQYTNFTFCDYLNYRRIKVAEELLVQPGLSITEVALQSGFSSISTFNRLFKLQKNCTPSQFRAKNHQPRFAK